MLMKPNHDQELDAESGMDLVVGDEDEIELVEGEEGPQLDSFGMTEEEVVVTALKLRTDIAMAEQASETRNKQYEKWRRQVEAQPQAKLRTINPLRNPSNVMPPLTQIHVQTMAANLTNYFEQDPFWSWEALADGDNARRRATFLTKYFKLLAISPSDLNLTPVKRTIFQEGSLHDKCVVKILYTVNEWNYKREDPDLPGAQKMETMVYHEGPEIIPIPQEDFVYPQQWFDLRYMPWIAHIIHLPEHELVARGEKGTYENVDKILERGRESANANERARATSQGNNSSDFGQVYDLAEVYFYKDVDGDGAYEDYIWTIDMLTGTVLRKQYNDNGMRPFEVFRYIERPYSLGGRGVGQICEGMQDEVEGIHNARNDNIKLANMRMLTMSSATRIKNGEEVFPGKIWTNDTDQEIKSLQLGEVYPSSLQAEQQTWQLAAQATGQSEVMRGFGDPTLGQRDTFRGQQMRLASSKGIFGAIADGMKETFSRVALQVMLQLINHKDEVIARETRIKRLTEKEMAMLTELLSISPSDVPNQFTYTVTAINQEATPEAKMQAMGQFAQLYSQWGLQSTQIASTLFTPQGLAMQKQAPALYTHLLTIYTGSARLMENILKLTGITDDPGNIVPNVDLMEYAIAQQNKMVAAQLKQMEATSGPAGPDGAIDSNTSQPQSPGLGEGLEAGSNLGGPGPEAGSGGVGAFQSSGMGNPAGNS